MPNLQNLPSDTTDPLEAVGGEPLAGSGFEAEAPEPGFAQTQPFEDDVWHSLKRTSQEDKPNAGHHPATSD